MIVMSLLLTACWDRTEVNDVAFVMGSAVDKEGDQIRATIQIALPGQLGGSKGGGGGTSGNKNWYLLSKTADTIRQANHEQQSSVSRRLNFSHRRTLLIGEEMAREGIEPIIDVLARIPQNRLTAFVLITKGSAAKVLAARTPAEQFPAEALRELAAESMKVPRTLSLVINAMLSEGIDLAIPAAYIDPTVTTEGDNLKDTIKVEGLAVFKQNKLADFLEKEEAIGVLLAMEEAQTPEVTVKAPEGEGKIVAQFLRYDTVLDPVIRGDEITFRILIDATGTVLENESNFQLSQHAQIEMLEESLEHKVKADVENGIRKLQQLESDAVGFGKTIYNKKPEDWRRLKENWYEHFTRIHVEVIPALNIENIGSIIKPFGRKEQHLE